MPFRRRLLNLDLREWIVPEIAGLLGLAIIVALGFALDLNRVGLLAVI